MMNDIITQTLGPLKDGVVEIRGSRALRRVLTYSLALLFTTSVVFGFTAGRAGVSLSSMLDTQIGMLLLLMLFPLFPFWAVRWLAREAAGKRAERWGSVATAIILQIAVTYTIAVIVMFVWFNVTH